MRATIPIYAGAEFGLWTVLEERKEAAEKVPCRCACGVVKECLVINLRLGRSRGCRTCHNRIAPRTHGESYSATYRSWGGIFQRCDNPKNSSWADYGGKGVKVCNRWYSYENFLEDMGERPEGCSLGRIGDCGNYEPANCRWMSQEEQVEHAAIKRLMKQAGYTF